MITLESKKKISGLWTDDYEAELKGESIWVLIFLLLAWFWTRQNSNRNKIFYNSLWQMSWWVVLIKLRIATCIDSKKAEYNKFVV